MGNARNLMVVAGEHSGDRHAAALVRAFGRTGAAASWFGAGGPALAGEGAEILVPMEHLAVVGIGEVLSRLPSLWRDMGLLKEALSARRPDAVVLVDFPDFNFRLARKARALGIPVVYYITPQVWAWRKGRARFLRDAVDLCLVIFPFEETFLRERGVNVRFVGHPLAELAGPPSPRGAFLGRHGLPLDKPVVALLPGSRASEVRRNLPILAEAGSLLAGRRPGISLLVPWAEGLPDSLWEPFAGGPLRRVAGEYLDVLGHADAAAVASGTATLEAALMGVPQVIVYRVKKITYEVGRRLVRIPRVGLPNVVLEREAVPERIQDAFTGPGVCGELERMLADGVQAKDRAAAIAAEVRNKLGEGQASARAARALVEFVEGIRRPSGPCRP